MSRSLSSDPAQGVTRREFLAAAGLGGVVAAAEFGRLGQAPTFVVRVRRAFDLLDLELAFIGFREHDQHLVASPGSRPLVAVHFPPQNLAEAIFDEKHDLQSEHEVDPLVIGTKPNANSPVPPIRSYLSGPSRLVFAAPRDVRLPLQGDVGAVDCWLRALSQWPLQIPPEAVGGRTFTPRPPRLDETCLEVPYRLLIAPRSHRTRWLTTSDRLPFDRPAAGATEVWNAALLSRERVEPARPSADIAKLAELEPALAPLSDITLQATAVFSPDYTPGRPPGMDEYYPGKQDLSLKRATRYLLVEQMAHDTGWIDVEHLVLSALGADASFAYFNPKSFDELIRKQLDEYAANPQGAASEPQKPVETLMVWKHRMVVGRDVYFVEAYFGALFPMVHPALYIEITQRKFASRELKSGESTVGPPGAYLLKRRFIVVRQPERRFTDGDSPFGREMPVKSAVIGWSRSPNLADPFQTRLSDDFGEDKTTYQASKVSPPLVFLPRPVDGPNTGRPVRWPVTFTDDAGRQATTSDAVLLFASNVILGHQAWQSLKEEYRLWPVPAKLMGLAPEVATAAGQEIPPPEREGVGRLGEALAAWQAAGRTPLEAGNGLVERLPTLAAMASVYREVGRVWAESAGNATKTIEEFLNSHVATLSGQPDAIIKAVDAALKVHAAHLLEPVEVISDRLTTAIKSATAAMQQIQEGTLNAVAQKLRQINMEVNVDEFRELNAELQAVERVTAALETHAIKFGSQLVDQLSTQIKPLTEAIGQAGGNLAQAKERAKTELDKQIGSLPDYKPFAEKLKKQIDLLATPAQFDQYMDQLKQWPDKAQAIGSERFHAVMEEVHGILPSMKAIVPNYPVENINLTAAYLARGIRGVEQGIFAEIQRNEEQLAKVKEILGQRVDAIKNGLATPRALIQGLSTQLGAVAGKNVEQIRQMGLQKFDELKEEFKQFQDAIPDAKLFGVIGLRDLIGTLAKGQLPSINLVQWPEKSEHTWKWTIPIKPPGDKKDFGILKYYNGVRGKPVTVCLNLVIQTTTRLPKPQELLAKKLPEGRVRLDAYMGQWNVTQDRPEPPAKGKDGVSFSVELLSLIEIQFRQVRIEAEYALGNPVKPSIKPELAQVDFLGPLKFIKTLQEKIGNLGGGFKLALTPSYLSLSYSFLVPPISFGAFSLRNIRLSAELMLPFADDPLTFRFSLASFAVPFELTVMAFGGRGFLAVQADTRGERMLEGAMEFGGSLAFDVGVASGGLYVMAGVYFRITQSQTVLSGYLRAGGTLDVLGLIHASVEFMLNVSYREAVTESNGQRLTKTELYGTATLTVSIELFMFSIDVHITMEKKIGGDQESKRISQEPMALENGRSDRFLVAFQQDQPSQAETFIPPQFYFAQPGHPGRFESREQWRQEYWSQFDFCDYTHSGSQP